MRKWNSVETIITATTVAIALLTLMARFFVGASTTVGVDLLINLVSRPSLHLSHHQFSSNFTTLTVCEIMNVGQGTAKDISIYMETDSNTPFEQTAVPIDPERLLKIVEGGEINDNYLRGERERLSGHQQIGIVIETSQPINYACRASSAGGVINLRDEPYFNLKLWDFAILMLIQMAVIGLVLFISRNNLHQSSSSEPER